MKHIITLSIIFVISILSFYHLGKQAGSRKLEQQLFQDQMVKKHLMAELDICNSKWKTNCSLRTTVYSNRIMYYVTK